MSIGTSRDDLLEEQRIQIEQYVLDQPWRRRPALPIPLRLSDVSPFLEMISRNGFLLSGAPRRVSNEQWRDLWKEWESRDPTTEVPLAKRIIDLYGDAVGSFLDSNPLPNTPNLSLIHISEPTRPY